MFEDEELVSIFKTESDERLQSLDQGLLRLEADPHDSATINELFREAHNLKGAARMLGVVDVGTVAHRFEDILGDARRGELVFTSDRIDGLYYGLDAIRKLVREALERVPAGVDLPLVLAVVSGERPPPGRSTVPPEEAVGEALRPALDVRPHRHSSPTSHEAHVESEASLAAPGERVIRAAAAEVQRSSAPRAHPESELVPAEPGQGSEAVPIPGSTPASFRIETIRVEPQKLDALMTHAGELTVTKSRIARRLTEIEELIVLQEEWLRELPRTPRKGLDDLASPVAANHGVSARERVERLGTKLEHLKVCASEDMARLEFLADNLESGIRSIRLLPLSTIFNLFPRMVRDLAREQGKEVGFVIEGGEIAADKRVIEEIKDPLMHMLRNAVDHGIEEPADRERRGKSRAAVLRLRAVRTANNIVIEIEDDGRGIDVESIRNTALARRVRSAEELALMTAAEIRELIFAPGFSTRAVVTDVSGRGVGLDVVRAKADLLKGTLAVESETGHGCRMRLYLPLTLATSRVLLVAAAGQVFALSLEFVETARLVAASEIFPVRGSDTILVEGGSLTVVPLESLLGLTRIPPGEEIAFGSGGSERSRACIIISAGKDRLGVLVDDLIDEQEIVLKQFGALLKRVPNVSGAAILGSGEVCIVLNAADLLKCARKRLIHAALSPPSPAGPRKLTLLLVEDSLTTRTQEKRILEGAGYEVVTAVDGVDGYSKFRSRAFDAVVSDVEMPNMDGLTLTTRIRQDPANSELPIILVTSLGSDESRRKGIEAGASAYLVKATFDQAELLATLRRLV